MTRKTNETKLDNLAKGATAVAIGAGMVAVGSVLANRSHRETMREKTQHGLQKLTETKDDLTEKTVSVAHRITPKKSSKTKRKKN